MSACPEDETLLAMIEGRVRGDALAALDSHLDACASCRAAVAMLGSGPRPRERALARGEALGRFLVIEPVGEGAMGVVYAAFDPELERKVALKVLHAERGDAKARARLVREAQAMARLSHPNVVTVYDVGVDGDAVYVAMELVRGASLRAWLATPRTPRAILELFAAAGAGLQAAHDAGLVHRDFKPENVIVGPGDVPKVGDFGLAFGGMPDAALDEDEAPRSGEDVDAEPAIERSGRGHGSVALVERSETRRARRSTGEAAPDPTRSRLTRTGALLGTPAYMAPEQLDGEDADARADQFAFCVALFEALMGARPFRGESLRELRDAIAAGPDPAPLRRLPAPIAAALRRGLRARRGERFEDMRALLAALRPARRPSAIAVGVGAALACGAVAFAFAAWPTASSGDPCAVSRAAFAGSWSAQQRDGLAGSTVRALDAWASRWTAERVTACEATHVAREQSEARMDRRMACLDRQRDAFDVVLDRVRRAESAPFAIDAIETLPDPATCAIDTRVAPPPAASAEAVRALRRRVDAVNVRVVTADAAAALGEADAIVEEATALGYGPLTAEAHLARAGALRVLARFDDAEADAERALLEAEAAGDDRGAVEGWLERVRVAGERGRYTEAARHARHAEASIVRAGSPADQRDALLMIRGVLRTNLGELVEAEDDLRAALASTRDREGAQSPKLASIHTSLGNVLRVVSRYDESLVEHERALALDRAALGDAHPRVGRDLHNVAGLLRRLGRTVEAQDHYERALAIKRASLGDDHPEVALTLNSLGLMAREGGDGTTARRRWERALAVFAAHEHGDAALVRFNLALLDVDEARWSSALDHVDRAIALDSERIGPRSKRVGSQAALRARVLRELGRLDEAEEAARLALDIARELGDPELDERARALLQTTAPPARPREASAATSSMATSTATSMATSSAPTSSTPSTPTSSAPTSSAPSTPTPSTPTPSTPTPSTPTPSTPTPSTPTPSTSASSAATTSMATAPPRPPRPTGSGSYGAGQPWE
jgi:serine/threonine protein kinase/tetratricopeptide (TPR) repeat protein